MLELTLICLFSVTTVAVGLSLLDSWLRGSNAYRSLKREQGLLDAGFVTQVHAHEMRLRAPSHGYSRRTLAAATRPYARHLPLPVIQSTSQIAG